MLQQRIHPAASRVKLLSEQTPASFIALRPAGPGRRRLHRPTVHASGGPPWSRPSRRPQAPIHLTPATRDPRPGRRSGSPSSRGPGWTGWWPSRCGGTYQPDKRVMFKIKHQRTADCVVAGYRVHKSGPDSIGSLLLGLYNDAGELASVGVIGAFPAARRKELFTELQPLVTTFDDHPWAWAKPGGGRTRRRATPSTAAGTSARTCRSCRCGPELVVEVRYEHMEGVRFRHTAQFNRWRPDRDPRSCTYEQLEEPVILRPGRHSPWLAARPHQDSRTARARGTTLPPCPTPQPPRCWSDAVWVARRGQQWFSTGSRCGRNAAR